MSLLELASRYARSEDDYKDKVLHILVNFAMFILQILHSCPKMYKAEISVGYMQPFTPALVKNRF